MTRSVMLNLRSSDGQMFRVSRDVAMHIKFIRDMLADVDEYDGMEIPISEVKGQILRRVIEFCEYHHQHQLTPNNADQIDEWEKQFVRVDKCVLFHLILAANFLAVQPLLDLTCKTVSDMIKGKTADEIREHFKVDDDFTLDE